MYIYIYVNIHIYVHVQGIAGYRASHVQVAKNKTGKERKAKVRGERRQD